jgi:hypothetical protein
MSEEYTINDVKLMKREAERSILETLKRLEIDIELSVGSIELLKSQYIGHLVPSVAAVKIELEFK